MSFYLRLYSVQRRKSYDKVSYASWRTSSAWGGIKWRLAQYWSFSGKHNEENVETMDSYMWRTVIVITSIYRNACLWKMSFFKNIPCKTLCFFYLKDNARKASDFGKKCHSHPKPNHALRDYFSKGLCIERTCWLCFTEYAPNRIKTNCVIIEKLFFFL